MPPLLIDIPQMIDLALGTPEIGVVNFTVLHSVLHAITEILSLDKYRVEFRGNYGVNVEKLIHHIPLQPILTVQEFKVEAQFGQEQKAEQRTLVPKQRDDQFDKILVIRKTEEMDGVQESDLRIRRTVQQPVQIISQDDFRKLGPKSGSIHDPVGRYLPNNQDVIDSGRGESEGSSNPVGEMWHVLNVTKRLDATEVAIEKLTSLMRDVTEEYRKMKNSVDRFSAMADVSHLADKIDILEKTVHDNIGKHSRVSKQTRQADGKPVAKGKTIFKQPGTEPTLSRQGTAVVTDGPAAAALTHVGAEPGPGQRHDSTEQKISDRKSGGGMGSSDNGKAHHRESENSENVGLHRRSSTEETIDDYYELKSEVDRLKSMVESLNISPPSISGHAALGSNVSGTGLPHLIPGGGTKGSIDLVNISRRTELLETKMNTVEHQIFDLEKELAEMVDRFEDEGRPNGAHKADVTGIADIHSRVNAIKADLENNIGQCSFLMGERDQIVENIEDITRKIGALKKDKVDKNEIDELLAEKADYNMLQRKVSFEEFDATKRHLTKGVVEALKKLSEQSHNWEKAIDDVRTMTASKVGREELTPLREYIDGKISIIQERLKALAALRRDAEAAGTKSKFLRHVNCISCDQDVIMRLDEPRTIPRGEAVMAPNSLKPFLVYELDSIRKQMRDPKSRNMHHFETMTKESHATADGLTRKLANRYCGGSHTILTPQDRVQRCKFNKKLMPADCFVKTDEGCYYKATKKQCICPEQQRIPPVTPKKTSSARSSKIELVDLVHSRPQMEAQNYRLEAQSPPLDILKDANSVRSSISEMKSGRAHEESNISKTQITAPFTLAEGRIPNDPQTGSPGVYGFDPISDNVDANGSLKQENLYEEVDQPESEEKVSVHVGPVMEGEQKDTTDSFDNHAIVQVEEELPQQDIEIQMNEENAL